MKSISVEKALLLALGNGSVEKSVLLEQVRQTCGVTVHAVYKALRQLVSLDVVTIHKNSVSMTLLHIEKELAHWEQVSAIYNTRPLSGHFLGLQEGESLNLRFKTLNELDAYWVHAFILLERNLPDNLPTYSVIPHDWFYYGRRETDIFWTKRQRRKQRLVITHPLDVDMLSLRERKKQGYEMTPNVNPFLQEEHEYYTLAGDWIFKVSIDKKAHQRLIEIVKKAKKLADINQTQLQKLLSQKGINTMKIYRNKRRAETMSSKVKKYFE